MPKSALIFFFNKSVYMRPGLNWIMRLLLCTTECARALLPKCAHILLNQSICTHHQNAQCAFNLIYPKRARPPLPKCALCHDVLQAVCGRNDHNAPGTKRAQRGPLTPIHTSRIICDDVMTASNGFCRHTTCKLS